MKGFRFFLLSVLALFMSIAVDAKPGTCKTPWLGREPPKDLSKYTLQASLLEGVLKDQLNIETPVHEVAYAFISYWPGAVYEDFFNGGKHVVIIIAEFAKSMRGFKAAQFHLGLIEDLSCPSGDGATLRNEAWDFAAASLAVEKKNRFRALGRVIGGKNFEETSRILRLKSGAYFKDHKEYKYFSDNCGAFVETAIGWIDPEFADQIDVPLAPAMRR